MSARDRNPTCSPGSPACAPTAEQIAKAAVWLIQAFLAIVGSPKAKEEPVAERGAGCRASPVSSCVRVGRLRRRPLTRRRRPAVAVELLKLAGSVAGCRRGGAHDVAALRNDAGVQPTVRNDVPSCSGPQKGYSKVRDHVLCVSPCDPA